MEKRDGTRKQEKQKMGIRIGGGGGVVGVLLLGGVAAIATVVSVSVIGLRKRRANRTRRSPECTDPPPPQSVPKLELNNQLDDQGEGLVVVLQDSSPPPPYYDPSTNGIKDMSVTQFDFTTLDVTKALISDECPVLDIRGSIKKPSYLSMKGIKPSGHLLDVEITEIMAKGKIIEAFQADLFAGRGNDPLLLIRERGELVKEVVIEAAEAVDDKAEDDPEEREHDNGGNASEKDGLQMAPTEGEDSDDCDVEEDEEETTEKGEGSSEGTGESSMDSGAEAIWPAESVQEFSLKLRELMINDEKAEEKIETEENGVHKDHNNRTSASGKSMTTRSKRPKKEILRRINPWRVWIWASWLLVLMLAAATAALFYRPML